MDALARRLAANIGALLAKTFDVSLWQLTGLLGMHSQSQTRRALLECLG